MKRATLIISAFSLAALQATAQYVTYDHDDAKMNQITVAEIGAGGLTPSLYYDLLHNNYQKTAAQKNKMGFRTTASIAGYWQVDDAEKLDSAMTKRAKIEAWNVTDRSVDIAWKAESQKINSKMNTLQRNINRIVPLGGTPAQRQQWMIKYNTLRTAIVAIQDSYMQNSQRKKQYLQIYADAARANETLVKFLVYLDNDKSVKHLLSSSYEKPNNNASIAAEAISRWREAGVSRAVNANASQAKLDKASYPLNSSE